MKTISTIIRVSILLFIFTTTTYSQPIPSCDSTISITKRIWPKGYEPILPIDPPPALPPQAEVRKVFWLHGLGGDEGNWQNAGAITQDDLAPELDYPPRKVESEYLDMSTNNSHISTSASVLLSEIRKTSTASGQTPEDARDNILICHSQGGIVARYLDMLYEQPSAEPRRIGGIVTFGTPHGGALIVNNSISNTDGWSKMQQFFDDACVALKAGPLIEKIETSFILDIFLSGEVVNQETDQFCHLFSDILPPLLKRYNTQLAEEYAVNAEELAMINNFETEIPRVTFYGIEDPGEELWRTAHYLLNDPNDDYFFDAIHDHLGVEYAESNKMKYLAKVEAWNNLALNWGPFINYVSFNNDLPGACALYNIDSTLCANLQQDSDFDIDLAEIEDIIRGWAKGYNWWLKANDYFLEVNGGLEYEWQSSGKYECWCRILNSQGEVLSNWALNTAHTANIDTDCRTTTLFGGLTEECQVREAKKAVAIYKDNDGIVLAESAGGWPNTFAFSMPGSNHQQMRNDTNLKLKLLELWEGNVHNKFFKTETK